MLLKIPSKKIQINTFEHELTNDFIAEAKEKISTLTSISIQGNSYSVDFCDQFSNIILAKSEKL